VGEEIVRLAAQFPAFRSLTLRALEPLGAIEETPPASARRPSPRATTDPAGKGVDLALQGVSVQASGHTILEQLNLDIAGGSHVAIVGPSGAGKSTLVGLFLGWHRAAEGEVLVAGQPLDAAALDRIRLETAWVDPAVRLWNRTLLENILYGSPGHARVPLQEALIGAGLPGVLERLPDGLQTLLGEGGALVSGGEGQRIRLGRALVGMEKRLAILDEPFRGLDPEARCALLAEARRHWESATLLCVTHDISSTRGFSRVLVVDGGRVVEDGAPHQLAEQEGSHYRRLLAAERSLQTRVWSHASWRRVRMVSGRLSEDPSGEPA
jgi:ATP-binding cassette subfamily B protein